MHITKFSDYTLRVLIYLAANKGKKASAREIAGAYDISFHHVAKAAQWLASEGYVETDRGRAGGMTLSRPAQRINIGALLGATERDTVLVDCMRDGGGACCIAPACGLKSALAKAQAAFYDVLRGYTLADITGQKQALASLLLAADSPH